MTRGEMIGVAITLLVFMIGHLGGAIWFASRVNTQMQNMTDDIKQIVSDLRLANAQSERIAVLESRVADLANRLTTVRVRALEDANDRRLSSG